MNQEPTDPRIAAEVELRSLSQSVYIVNEKRPPSYVRAWKVYVLHCDGQGVTYWEPDTDAGRDQGVMRALHSARTRSAEIAAGSQ